MKKLLFIAFTVCGFLWAPPIFPPESLVMGDPHLFSYFGLADTASSTDLYEAYYERIGPLLLAGLHYEANYLKAAYTILLNRRDEYLKNRGRCGNRIRVFAEVKP